VTKLIIISDRGGHWHNAQMLLDQMRITPDILDITPGPEIPALKARFPKIILLPTLFTFLGKHRFLNPAKIFLHIALTLFWAFKFRPREVLSLGATNVVPFCYFCRFFGARITHVECMNQVKTASITGRILYPIATAIYVQWPDLLPCYGPKARYEGWVL
jgi:UDP-N-acetylglucosamine:LPS N-acetylglucosamine transferase